MYNVYNKKKKNFGKLSIGDQLNLKSPNYDNTI